MLLSRFERFGMGRAVHGTKVVQWNSVIGPSIVSDLISFHSMMISRYDLPYHWFNVVSDYIRLAIEWPRGTSAPRPRSRQLLLECGVLARQATLEGAAVAAAAAAAASNMLTPRAAAGQVRRSTGHTVLLFVVPVVVDAATALS